VKQLAFAFLLLAGGCLDYEVEVETVVAKDGSAQRSVRIRETSKKHMTWRCYAEPRAPYVLAGDDAKGYEAKAKFAAGRHSGGVRFVEQAFDGDYGGSAESKGRPAFEGHFAVGADDIEIGTLYHYREEIDIGIDPAKFRAGLLSVVEVGADLLVTTLELAEPELDFKPVRDQALTKLVPEVTSALLAIHTQLLLMEARGRPIIRMRKVDELLRSPEMKVILAELDRLGIRRRKDAPETNDPSIYFDFKSWTSREALWSRLRAPLEGADDALRDKLWETVILDSSDTGNRFWEAARERLFPEEKSEALEKELRLVAVAGIGAPVANELFDDHQLDISVRMPGRILSTNGVVEKTSGRVSWRIDPGGGTYSNPSPVAWSFVPSEAMVGRIVDVEALVHFGQLLAEAPNGEREGVKLFLERARKSDLDAARETHKSNELVTALADALAPARE